MDGKTVSVLRTTITNDALKNANILNDQEVDPGLKRVFEWKPTDTRLTWNGGIALSAKCQDFLNSILDYITIGDQALKRVLESADGTKKRLHLVVHNSMIHVEEYFTV